MALVDGLPVLGIEMEETAQVPAKVIRTYTGTGILPLEVVIAIKELWALPTIKQAFKKSNQFFVQDTAE
ncbi:hypothetical protein HKX48_004321 [Thoreauomyces humboldtii]|nr:hypothetical protein HKX48_004321 [Thoreauomyces humboldtii]